MKKIPTTERLNVFLLNIKLLPEVCDQIELIITIKDHLSELEFIKLVSKLDLDGNSLLHLISLNQQRLCNLLKIIPEKERYRLCQMNNNKKQSVFSITKQAGYDIREINKLSYWKHIYFFTSSQFAPQSLNAIPSNRNLVI